MKTNFQKTVKQETNKRLEEISKDYVFYSIEERFLALKELEHRNGLSNELIDLKKDIESAVKMREEELEMPKAKYKSRNPALNSNIFTKIDKEKDITQHMTIAGTVKKTGILAAVVLVSFLFTWNFYQAYLDFGLMQPYIVGGSLSAMIVGFIIIYRKTTAPYLAPIYCLLEGLALGGLSAFMEEIFSGIVIQAVILTFGILLSLLIIYKLKIIRATENFKLIITSATAGIAIYYLISLCGNFLGFEMPYIHENSTVGIIFSLFVIIIAALNLVIDFDFIEQGEEQKVPKYMEWYAAFGLMVTVIWLYIEILRILSKMRKR